jgi:tetratricopeptide (TPR) repeat protein
VLGNYFIFCSFSPSFLLDSHKILPFNYTLHFRIAHLLCMNGNLFVSELMFMNLVCLFFIIFIFPPLRRCLWEIYCAFSSNTPLAIGLPPNQRAAFLQGVTDEKSAVMDALLKIDAENSDAFKQEDRNNIHRAIRESGPGFHGLNVAVKDQLREWYVATAAELAEETAEDDSVKAAETLYNLAASLHEFGEDDKAIKFAERSLEITLAARGEQHSSTAATYCFTAMIYKTQGEYCKALKHFERALKIYLATRGEQHSSTASIYNGMATVYQAQGEHSKALEHYERALKIKLITQGEQHPSTAATYGNMAHAYLAQGGYGKALKHYEQVLKIQRATLGEQHPSTAITYSGMAGVYKAQGGYGKALEHYERALKIYLATRGEQHSFTASTYDGMAAVYRKQGEYGKALEYNERALKIKLITQGEQHPSTAATYGNMAHAYLAQGEYGKALEYYEQVLKIHRATLGEQHHVTAMTQGNIGKVLCKTPGRKAEGKALLQQCVKVMTVALGAGHPHVCYYRKRLEGV